MTSLMVREYLPEDAGFILDMEKRNFSTPLPEDYISAITGKENTVFLVCLDENGRRVGYAGLMWVLDEGSIITIAVDENHRGKGAGTAIIDELKTFSTEHSLSFITLEVRQSNAAAIALYEKTGFSVCGNMKNYYSNPKEDAIIMTCYIK